MIQEEKKALRKVMMDSRDRLIGTERSDANRTIIALIRSMKEYQLAKTVGIYYPIGSEVSLLPLCQDSSKQFCYPKIIDPKNAVMEFRLDSGMMTDGPFHTKEPTGASVDPNDIDLMIVPGLAYSFEGVRLGYGKGYYDRYLRNFPHPYIGVAFSRQLLQTVPSYEHDVLFTRIVTERGILCIPH